MIELIEAEKEIMQEIDNIQPKITKLIKDGKMLEAQGVIKYGYGLAKAVMIIGRKKNLCIDGIYKDHIKEEVI